MFATTVTWDSNTLSSIYIYDDESFTQDGVTVTSLNGVIDGDWQGGSSDASFKFSTSLGNFTKIEITGTIYMLGGSGWTLTSPGAVWTGEANETTFGQNFDNVSQIVFTIAEPAPAAKYYIVGTMNSWQVDENYEMNPSLEAETEEYFYTLDLTTSSEFKVVKVQNGQQSWIPEGMGNNYGQNGEITEDGEYTVYFRPNFDGEGEDWFYSCIYAEKTGEFVPETPTYYLVGNMTEWDVDENYELNPNIDSDIEEYFYVLDLTTSSQFKVVKVQNGQQTWFPSGMGNNYGENGEITEDGEYTVYFRPNYNGGEDWFYNCIYVSKNEPEPAEVTVVFAANNKTVERTVTLPHTFKCDWNNGMDGPDELDIIIHELYNDYYYCNSNMNASGSDQVEVGTEEDPKNDYITIKGVFEGTATVTGDYLDYIAGDYGEHNYSITISIKGDEPQPQPQGVVTLILANLPEENRPATIELAGTFDEGTAELEKLDTGWFIYNFIHASADATGKFRDKTNPNMVLCEFIPANGDEEGKWVQAIFKISDYGYWDEDGWKGTACMWTEIDVTGEQYAWMEGMPEPQPTGIEHIVLTEKAKKVIVDGMVYIVRDGKLFNMTGAQVR